MGNEIQEKKFNYMASHTHFICGLSTGCLHDDPVILWQHNFTMLHHLRHLQDKSKVSPDAKTGENGLLKVQCVGFKRI